jgi:hypothetical protein
MPLLEQMKEALKKLLKREPTSDEFEILKTEVSAAINDGNAGSDAEISVNNMKSPEESGNGLAFSTKNPEMLEFSQQIKELISSNKRLITENTENRKILEANEQKAFQKKIEDKVQSMIATKKIAASDENAINYWKNSLKNNFDNASAYIDSMQAIGTVEKSTQTAQTAQTDAKPLNMQQLRDNVINELNEKKSSK